MVHRRRGHDQEPRKAPGKPDRQALRQGRQRRPSAPHHTLPSAPRKPRRKPRAGSGPAHPLHHRQRPPGPGDSLPRFTPGSRANRRPCGTPGLRRALRHRAPPRGPPGHRGPPPFQHRLALVRTRGRHRHVRPEPRHKPRSPADPKAFPPARRPRRRARPATFTIFGDPSLFRRRSDEEGGLRAAPTAVPQHQHQGDVRHAPPDSPPRALHARTIPFPGTPGRRQDDLHGVHRAAPGPERQAAGSGEAASARVSRTTSDSAGESASCAPRWATPTPRPTRAVRYRATSTGAPGSQGTPASPSQATNRRRYPQ